MATKPERNLEAVRDILVRARALLAEPERWTQMAFARGRLNSIISPRSTHACCWCLGGAIERAAPDLRTERRARAVLETLLEDVPIEVWNDAPGRTHAEVLALLDRAIAEVAHGDS